MIQQANALLRLALNPPNVFGAALGGVLVAAAGPGLGDRDRCGELRRSPRSSRAMLSLPEVVREQAPNFVRELAEGWHAFRSRTWLWSIVAPVLDPERRIRRGVPGARAGAGERALRRSAHLGPDPRRRGGGPDLRRPGDAARRGRSGCCWWRPSRSCCSRSPLVLLAPPRSGRSRRGRGLRHRRRARGLRRLLGHDDAAADPRATCCPGVYAYDTLGSICLVPVGLAVIGPIADAIGTEATLYGAAALIVARDAAGVRRARRQGAAKEVTARVFSSRSSR